MSRFILAALTLLLATSPFDRAIAQESGVFVPPADSMLAPTSAPPWNPPRPAPAADAWETAVRLPGRIVSLPLSALGVLTKRGLLSIEANSIVPRVLYVFSILPAAGIELTPASLGDRTGFGATLRVHPPGVRRVVTAEVSGSTRNYTSAGVRLDRGPVSLGYEHHGRPEDRFYGFGVGTSDEDTTTVSTRLERVRFGIGSPWTQEERPGFPIMQIWVGPRFSVTRNGQESGVTPLGIGFPELLPALGQKVEHLMYGAVIAMDRRTGRPHWSEGWRATLNAERFDRPVEFLALHQAGDPPRYNRFTFEGEAGASFMRDPRTFRLAWRLIDMTGNPPVLVDLSVLGGSQGLHGFQPGRFQDRDLVLTKLSYLFPLAQHFELDVHVEAGGVYGDLYKHPRIREMPLSYGVALRPRTVFTPLGSVGLDWCREGVRFRYSVGGVE